ncbi:MAG TPA: hypothetical protein VF228_24910 [Iamia sp.]
MARTAPTLSRRRRVLLGVALVAASLAATTGIGSSPAGAGAPPYCDENDITFFVCESYMSFARRTPTEAETDYWASQLPARKTVFLATLGRSLESRHRMIEAYYSWFADGEPSEADTDYWEGEVLKPNGFRRLEAALLTSYEGISFVSAVYETLIGREPEDGERIYWEGQVVLKGRNQVAADIGYSAEARNNRVHWTYQNELDFFPDVASRDYWAGRIKNGMSYLDLRIGLKTAAYPESTGICSTPAPTLDYGCDF